LQFFRMWSIILRKDIMSYDIVPNVWIINEVTCLYPDCGLSKTKKMARDCIQPEEDWDTAPIEVTKRDIGKLLYIVIPMQKNTCRSIFRRIRQPGISAILNGNLGFGGDFHPNIFT